MVTRQQIFGAAKETRSSGMAPPECRPLSAPGEQALLPYQSSAIAQRISQTAPALPAGLVRD
jgi:hypothetical protein